MIVFIVCVGVALVHILMLYIKNVISSICDSKSDFNAFNGGMVFGVIFSIVFLVEVLLLSSVLETPTPTAMDVHQGKTTIEYKIVDGEKTDSVIVFKK